MFAIALVAMGVGLGACDRKEPRPDKKGKSKGKAEIQEVREVPALGAPPDARSREIEALTGGHTRIVWSQNQDPKRTDAHANGKKHQLVGLGTRDGLGERVILSEIGNYARPMLTPDGLRVVYTDKGTRKVNDLKSYNPRCYVVNWDGSGRRELGAGYADELWVDPETGITWVYAVEKFANSKQVAVWGKSLVRFPLDDPKKREVVYDKGEIGVNNLQASRDGKRIASLFPWPHCGVLDVGERTWEPTAQGCWTSIAPDNSYLSWVFDGAHKNVTMVRLDTNEKWVVSMANLPDFQNKEMYHPRWSNHPGFFTITGHYPAGSREGSPAVIETYIGRFDSGATRVEGWVRVTRNKLAELFPDVWIEGGEMASLDPAQLGRAPEGEPEIAISRVREAETGIWPANEDGLVYAWDGVAGERRVGDRPCRMAVHGRARFGRYHDAVLGGGSAVPDEASLGALEAMGGETTVEFLFTAESDADGVLYADASRVVFVSDKTLHAKTGGMKVWNGGAIQSGVPTHLALTVQGEEGGLFRDGRRITEQVAVTVPDAGESVVFGDGVWEGSVKGIAIYARALPEDEITANAATWKARESERKPAARATLTGKLVEVTPLKSQTEIGAYSRALAVYTYEVESVMEGEYPHPKALVSHWYYMDDVFLSSMPREVGRSYELTIEASADHPQIESELTDYDGGDFETPLYFDVTTPEP